MLAADDGYSMGQRFGLVVTVVRAEGLPYTASKTVFRIPKKSKPQRRYVRVSVPGMAGGRETAASAVSSSVVVSGTECRWGVKETGGENIFLEVDRDALGATGNDMETPLDGTAEKNVLLEVEVLSDQSESGGEDNLLGRGQTVVRCVGALEVGDSQPRWVMLSLGGSSRGKIEIAVSTRATPLPDGTVQPDESGQDTALKHDGQTVPPCDANETLLEKYCGGEMVASFKDRHEDKARREDPGATKDNENGLDAYTSTSRSPKWGLPNMPGLKNALNVSLTRAANLRANQREAPVNNEMNPRSEDGSHEKNTVHIVAERDSARQETANDNLDDHIASENASPGKNTRRERQSLLSARHGMQSLKDSLQAKIIEASGMLRGERVREQDDTVAATELQDKNAPREKTLEGLSSDSESTPFSRSREFDLEADVANMSPERDSFDVDTERDTDGTREERAHRAQTDASSVGNDNNALSPPAATRGRTRALQEDTGKKTFTEVSRRGERRTRDHQVDKPSPLKSLLRAAAGDKDAQKGDGNTQNEILKQTEKVVGIGGSDYMTDTDGDENAADSEHAKETAAQILSAPVVASSIKAAAARIKTTLSSPKFAGTLKGLGWNTSKEESSGDNPALPPAFTGAPVGEVFSATSLTASSVGKMEGRCETEGDVGSSGSGSLAATTVLVAVFSASGLPETSGKGSFRHVKKDGTQRPFVRLSICHVSVTTSPAQDGDRKYRWGQQKEGETVEIVVPASVLPDAGLASLKLVIELWNKASEEQTKNVLLGSTEVPLADWLGKTAAWAELDSTSNRGGRVKLSVSVKEGGASSSAYPDGLDEAIRDDIDTWNTKKEAVAETDLLSEYPDTTNNMNIDTENTHRDQPELDPGESICKSSVVGRITDRDADGGSAGISLTCSDVEEGAEVTKGIAKNSYNQGESEANVPRLELGLISREWRQQASDQENTRPHAAPSAAKRYAEAEYKAIATNGEDANKQDIAIISDKGTNRGVGTVAPTGDGTKMEGDKDETQVDITSRTKFDDARITILVKEADSLTMSTSKAAFGKLKLHPTQDPYVVLSVCGNRRATSAVIEGGSKCRWSGEAGESVDLSTSYANLTTGGWGHAEADGPRLTVEVWNQESPTRHSDVFIGSSDVKLKEYLGCGPKWVHISRRKKSSGRVKIDVKCPVLQQSITDAEPNIDPKKKESHVQKQRLEAVEAAQTFWRQCHDVSEENQHEGAAGMHQGATDKDGQRNNVSTERSCVELHNQASIDKGNATNANGMIGEHGKTSPDAGTMKTSQGTDDESSPANIEPDNTGNNLLRKRNRASALLTLGKGDVKERMNDHATDEVDGHIFAIDTNDSQHSLKADKTNIDEVADGIPARQVGNVASAFGVTATVAISNERITPVVHEQPTTSDNLARAGPLKELSESERQQPSECGSDQPPQTASRGGYKSNGDTCAHANDRELKSKTLEAHDDHRNVNTREWDGDRLMSSHRKASKAEVTQVLTKFKHSGNAEQEDDFLAGQQRQTRQEVQALSQAPVNGLALATTAKRLERARDIVRRRRGVESRPGPVGRRRPPHAPPSVQSANLSTVADAEQMRAATTIQGAFRGRTARRSLRERQRAVVKIQAAYLGHMERKQIVGLRARTKRAKAEEQRARARRERIESMQQVCAYSAATL